MNKMNSLAYAPMSHHKNYCQENGLSIFCMHSLKVLYGSMNCSAVCRKK